MWLVTLASKTRFVGLSEAYFDHALIFPGLPAQAFGSRSLMKLAQLPDINVASSKWLSGIPSKGRMSGLYPVPM